MEFVGSAGAAVRETSLRSVAWAVAKASLSHSGAGLPGSAGSAPCVGDTRSCRCWLPAVLQGTMCVRVCACAYWPRDLPAIALMLQPCPTVRTVVLWTDPPLAG